jgi:FkbM family methyltransferase
MSGAPKFISYSANCEDVILNRLFGSRDSGFYIDVGAAHPLYDNDTKALYDRGWRGINIEPNAVFYRELTVQRPEDRNINVAVSDTPGPITFHEVIGTGLSTCDPEEAERAAAKGFEVVHYAVAAMSLREILEEAEPPEINLLKVDVEGFELKVLSSNDWSRFRPNVVLSEATFPESPRRRPDIVAPYLAQQGYRPVYFDGLNDYFIEQSFEPPPEVFDRPPNVFDQFEPRALHELIKEQENANTYIVSLQSEVEKARIYTASLQDELEKRSLAYDAIRLAYNDIRKQLRRFTLMAENYRVDVENARFELHSIRKRNHDLAGQLEEIIAHQVELAVARTAEVTAAQQALLTAEARASDALRLRCELHGVYSSTSWRITRPMRALANPRRMLRILVGQPPI